MFDLLHVDGVTLTKLPLRERRARISLALPNMKPGFVEMATSTELSSSPTGTGKNKGVPHVQTRKDAVETTPDETAQSIESIIYERMLSSLHAGTEGLMLKRLDDGAAYEPSKRSESWIKVKKDYCEGLRDSLDLVPIGAWIGQGRKVKGLHVVYVERRTKEVDDVLE